jgi:hypothetical protein
VKRLGNKQEVDEIGMRRTEPIRICYPESIRTLSSHLSYFLGNDIGQPAQFNANFPLMIRQVIDFYLAIQAMHGRALEVLGDNREQDRQFCLYLRSFAAGGTRFKIKSDRAQLSQEMISIGLDERIRNFVDDTLEGIMPVVSCLNTLDINTIAQAHKQPKPPAVLRLLSHNWIRTIDALIDRAQCVVMLFFTAHGQSTEGLQVELAALDRLGQMQRTILIFADDNSEILDQTSAYVYGAFNWPAWMPKPTPPALAQSLRTLAGDGHRRTVTLPAIDYPPCFVVDKDYSVSRFESGELSETDYAALVPGDLESNCSAFQEDYLATLQWWARIESNLESGRRPDIEDTANAMYAALHCFVLAATLEAYEPMARTLAMIAKAHYVITRTTEIALICAGGAQEFARLAGEDELAMYFGAMEADLRAHGGLL